MIIFLQLVTVGLVAVCLGVSTSIKKRIVAMSAEFDRLSAEVAENTSVVASAKAMIAGLAQQIRDSKDDPAALGKLADQLDASSTDLASAVAANTPADGGGSPTDGGETPAEPADPASPPADGDDAPVQSRRR